MLIEKTKIYGVTGIGGENPTLTRTDSAIDMTFTVGSSEIQSDFDRCYPWSDMREIVDSQGNVFVKIPKFYSKMASNGDGTYKLQISGCHYEGFSTLFIDGKGGEIPYVLVGKYEASGSSEKVVSKSGQNVLVQITLGNMRNACRANGEGYQQYDFLIHTIIQQLFMVEFATTNCQSIMAGWTKGTASLITGETDLVKSASGSGNSTATTNSVVCNADGLHACKYRGIENPWGNIWKWCDGISFSEEKIFICTDPTAYESGKTTAPYFYMGDRYMSTGYTSAVTPFEKMPLLSYTTHADGSDATYYCDMYFMTKAGILLTVGGNWSSKKTAGLWRHSAGSGISGANAEMSGRLCYKPIQNS